MNDELLSVDDLAALLKVPKSTVYAWRTTGRGPVGLRVGKYLRFQRADVEAWLSSLREGGDSQGRKSNRS